MSNVGLQITIIIKFQLSFEAATNRSPKKKTKKEKRINKMKKNKNENNNASSITRSILQETQAPINRR